MKNILSIVEELQANRGKLKKMEILKREIENTEFKSFIKYVLCPMHIYGIQNRKLNRFLDKTNDNTEFSHLFELFEYLLENNTGRDADAEAVAKFIDSEEDKELKELYKKAITKNLKMGIDKSVNEAWGKGFIHQFDVMLAKDFDKEYHKIKGREFVLTEKLDGTRLVVRVESGEVECFTRQGHTVEELVEVESEMRLLPDGVYDGELLIKNEDAYRDREVMQETSKIARRDGAKTGLNYHIFDRITLEDFENEKSTLSYISRRHALEAILSLDEYEHIALIPVLYKGNDLAVVPDMLEELEEEGKEGLMLNLTESKYVCKRTNFILKIKTMKSYEDFCVGVYEGRNKFEGMAGGIMVKYKDTVIDVGTGFSDEKRKMFWENPDSIVGRIVEVHYFRESKNANGGLNVSFSSFKGVRHDKTESSYN